MKLPAWYASLHEAQAHIEQASGRVAAAREGCAAAAREFRVCGHVLDAARATNG